MNNKEEHSHSPECPISCLEGLLSPKAYIPLTRGTGLKTINDVLRLHQNGELRDLRNIGELRFKEIEAALDSITVTESATRLPDLFLLIKLQTTSDTPVPESSILDFVCDSVFHLLDDLYVDTADGATLHIDADKWWLTERALSYRKN